MKSILCSILGGLSIGFAASLLAPNTTIAIISAVLIMFGILFTIYANK